MCVPYGGTRVDWVYPLSKNIDLPSVFCPKNVDFSFFMCFLPFWPKCHPTSWPQLRNILINSKQNHLKLVWINLVVEINDKKLKLLNFYHFLIYMVILQGFPNSIKKWEGIPPLGGGIRNFAGGRIFSLGGGNPRGSDFDHSNLFHS